MREPRWTPGPWLINEDDEIVFVQHPKEEPAICGLNGGEIMPIDSTRERLANARLIAAAPMLYEALLECMREHGGFVIQGECRRLAEKALNAARGEPEDG